MTSSPSAADPFLSLAAMEELPVAFAQTIVSIEALCGDGSVDLDEQCDDGNAADGDCCSASCRYEVAGSPCSDADACSIADSCDGGGSCLAGEPRLCDDGDFCNGVESCDPAIGCVAGAAPDLADGVACTLDVCDEEADEITHAPRDDECDNGLFCDGAEICDPVLDCQPGLAPALADGIACTRDVCDESLDQVLHLPEAAACDNGLFCDGVEVCDAVLDCQSGSAPELSDGVSCTEDVCDEAEDRVAHTPSDAACDNGLFCDGVEFCDALLGCQAGEEPELEDGVACTADLCNEEEDRIVHVPEADACDNGLFCDGVERCDALLDCQPGPPPVLDDGVFCTTDGCDEDRDEVLHAANDKLCDDGLFCTGREHCDAVLDCQWDGPPVLDDEIVCTRDLCDEAEDRIVHVPEDSMCDDGAFCNGAEICDADSGCQAGTSPVTDDGLDCTFDRCDESGDEILHDPLDAECDDGDLCTADSCDGLVGCVHDPIPACFSEFVRALGDPREVPAGRLFEVELAMDFQDATLGGGVLVDFDDALMAFESFRFDEALDDDPDFRVGPSGGDAPPLSIAFKNFEQPLAGDRRIGVLVFRALVEGEAPVQPRGNRASPFIRAADSRPQDVAFEAVLVRVPEPAVWLTRLVALGILLALARRRRGDASSR